MNYALELRLGTKNDSSMDRWIRRGVGSLDCEDQFEVDKIGRYNF